MTFPTHLTDRTLSVLIDPRQPPFQVARDSANFTKIATALNDPNTTAEELIALMKPIHAVGAAVANIEEVQVRGGAVYFGDEVLDTELTRRILEIIELDLPVEGWIKFATNLYNNPWLGARDELYPWLAKSDMPITPDGCFIAYKIVDEDFLDTYSRRVRSDIGTVVVMPGGRDAVDPNRRNVCSTGLHFCSRQYLPMYGIAGDHPTIVLLIKINPADVVEIPYGGASKGRCWRYEVVGQITREEAGLRTWPPYASGYRNYDWSNPEAPVAVEDDLDEAELDHDEPVPASGKFADTNEQLVVSAHVADDGTVTVLWPGRVPEPDVPDMPTEAPEAPETPVEDDAGPVDQDEGPVVHSAVVGTLDRTRFLALLERAEGGTLSALAADLGVSRGTVQDWKTKLFGKASTTE